MAKHPLITLAHRLGARPLLRSARRRPSARRVVAGAMTLIIGVVTSIVVTGSQAQATGGCGAIGYAYDAAGRLSGVSDQTGHVAHYTYDAVGNTTGVTGDGTPALWAQSFSPARGGPGAQVSITGGCFGPNPGDQQVLFGGGIAGAITLASTNRLVATVPAGATTGPITVVRGSDTAVTQASFTITATVGPVVTGVSPTTAVAGDTVTLTGSGFDSDPLNNVVAVNQTRAQVTAATSTSLTIRVPAGATTGKVTVRTPDGDTTSTADLFIVPSGYTVANVAVAQRIPLGTAQTVTIPTAGQIALLAFDLADGQYASVSLGSGTFGSCGLNAYVRDPKAVTAVSAGCVGSSGFLDRFGGASAGTWVLMLAASSSATGSISVTLNDVPPDATATAAGTVGGPATTVALTVPGQNGAVTFDGSSGQRVSFTFPGTTMWATITIKNPDGSVLRTASTITGDTFFEPVTLPATGTYTVAVNGYGAQTGVVGVRLYSVPPDASSVTSIGATTSVSITVAGQNAAITFTGLAGQRVSFTFPGTTMWATITIKNPDGTVLRNGSTITGNDFFEPVTLVTTGDYTVYIDGYGAQVGTVGVQLYDVPADATSTATVGGAATSVAITVPGQNASVTFAGTAGQRVSFTFPGTTMWATITIKNPDGTVLRNGSTITGNDFFEPVTLPVTGTFTVAVNGYGAQTGVVGVRLYDVPADAMSTATVGGSSTSVAVTVPGQNAAVTFAGTAGQRVSFTFPGTTMWATITIKNPDGSVLRNGSTITGNTFFEPVMLATTGTYTVYVDGYGSQTGTVGVQLYNVPADATAATTINGTGTTVTTTAPGQNATVTFTATAGERIGLAGSANSMGYTSFALKAPDGTSLYSTSSSGSWTMDPIVLPAAGTYTVAIDPSGSNVGSVTIAAYDVAGDATATAVIDGPAVTLTTTISGQNGVFSFDGTAGQRVSFTFPGSTTSFYGTVRKPDGTVLQSSTYTSSGSFYEPITLPATGTYTYFVDPSGSTIGTYGLRLYNVPADTTNTAAIDGAAVTLITTVPGQNGVFSFDGTAGQRVSFTFPGSTTSFYGTVKKPDGTVLQSSTYTSSGSFYEPITLPATGTYTYFVDPSGSTIGTYGLRLYSVPVDATNTAAVDGAAVTLSTTVPGQNGVFSFDGTAGQRVSFTFPGTTTSFYGTVKKPDGTVLQSSTYTSSGSFYEPITLPATGTYTYFVDPSGATIGTYGLRLYNVPADTTNTAAIDGAAVTLTTTVPGQNGVFSFAGTTGQRVSFTFPGSTTSFYGTVKNPDGTVLKSSTYTSSGSFYEPITLPATGTYTYYVDPSGATIGTYGLRLYNVPADTTNTAAIDGAGVTLTTTVPGQNGVFSFAGTTGQRVSFTFPGTTTSFYGTVKNPDGTVLKSSTYTSSGSFYEPVTLATTGTYTFLADPSGATIGTYGLRAYNVPPDATATATVNGSGVTVTTTAPGQNAVVSFDGLLNQIVTVSITGATTGSTTYTLRKPDGTSLGSTSTSGATASIANKTLPAAGTYTVLVDPGGTNVGSATVTITGTGGSLAAATLSQPRMIDVAYTQPSTPDTTTPGTPATDDTETWQPDRYNLAGADWTSHRGSDLPPFSPLQAPDGATAISGQVLLLNAQPLPGVTLRVDEIATRTDGRGRFLLTGLEPGHHELLIDGTTASGPGRSFGSYEVGVEVIEDQTFVLPYTIWMTRLDTQHAVSFPSPTKRDMVLTTPKIPGFEVRLPKGSVVKDHNDKVVTSLSITAIPVDRPPFPLPAGVTTPVYFTVQPGGSYVFPDGAQIVYPNTTHLAPRTRVDFWDYDADDKGWYIYGTGRVTANGKQIVPDPGVRVWEFSGAMINVGGQNGPDDGPGDDGDNGGDPVDLATGLFVESHTDLLLPDTLPIAITRTYRQRDTAQRSFGVGTNFSYGIFLQSAHQYTEADLVYPDGGKVHMVRTSPGTGWADAVFKTVDTTGPFLNATMAWNGNGWDLVRADGMVFVFGENQPLQAIRDRHGNTITITRSSGGQSGTITQITSPHGRWIKLSYDSGNRITQAQDNGGRTVGYEYDASGRLIKVTNPLGHVTQYTYDSSSRMTSITDARGITYLTNTYDSASRVATQAVAGSGTYQFAYTTDTNGAITRTDVTDPSGTVHSTSYDTGHRIVGQVAAAGTPLARTMATDRDPVTHQPIKMTDPYGRDLNINYDASARPTSVTAMPGTGSERTASSNPNGPFGQVTSVTDTAGKTTSYAYTPSGDLATVTDPQGRRSTATYNLAGQPTSMTDNSGRTTTLTYKLGELASSTDPLGRTTRYFIDAVGRRIVTVDPLGAASQTRYDAADNPVTLIDPLGGTTSLAYDANGSLTAVTDARGHTTTLAYDDADRLTSVTDPLGKTASRTYDPLGRITSTTDRRGKKTVTQYDSLGRATFVGYGAGPGPTYDSTLTATYDPLDRLISLADSATGTTSFGYDDLDQITSVTTAAGTITHTYDQAGRKTGTTIPGQGPITYAYDDGGLLSSISQSGQTVTWHRDGDGRITSIEQPNLTTAYSYNTLGQVSAIAYTGAAGSLGDLNYTYDPDGRVAQVFGSLAHVTIPTTGPPATYDNADRLISLGSQTFSYDDEGNLTGDGTRAYTWNSRDQLAAVSGPGLSAAFGYDSSGRRTSTTVNGATTDYLYDSANIVREQSGSATSSRLSAGTDQTLRRVDPAGASTPLVDGLGSVIGLVDDSGTLTTQYTYDPYGKVTASGAASANPQQYTGREYDAATGLLNNRMRYYSPDLGRFISQDPAGMGGGSTNPYLYALGDPVNLSDPNGDCPICVIVVAGVISGAVGVGMGWLEHKLEGRKYTWGDAAKDFLIWGTIGAATEGLGMWLRGARAAETVWDLDKFARGFKIEEELGGNLPKNFPTIDKFINGTATSIKSIDLGAKSYESASALKSLLKGYIDKVAGFSGNMTWGGATVGNVTSRVLEVGIPPGATSAQMNVINQMIQYAAGKGVTVIIHVIP
jgi:RHS repeat-associated protein